MRFHVRKRRQAPAVIIVALIDILIVLLIFLMVTTTFKQQPAMRLALAESTQAQKAGAQESTLLVVSIDPQGNLRLGTEGLPVTFERLTTELRAAIARNPDLTLALNIDKAAPWGQVVRVRDAAKEANVKMVNAYVKEAGKP
jgi:biopolymer transport protein ExbD